MAPRIRPKSQIARKYRHRQKLADCARLLPPTFTFPLECRTTPGLPHLSFPSGIPSLSSPFFRVRSQDRRPDLKCAWPRYLPPFLSVDSPNGLNYDEETWVSCRENLSLRLLSRTAGERSLASLRCQSFMWNFIYVIEDCQSVYIYVCTDEYVFPLRPTFNGIRKLNTVLWYSRWRERMRGIVFICTIFQLFRQSEVKGTNEKKNHETKFFVEQFLVYFFIEYENHAGSILPSLSEPLQSLTIYILI